MLISIIIPTCNRNDLLIKCLDLLSPAVQLTGIEYEVLVTDDSKTNLAKTLIEDKYNWVRWIEGPKKGPASNRNNGARFAKGDWLLFTDDDCLPTNNWINAYIKTINKSTDLVLEGATNADRPQERFDEESPINLHGDNLWSCNFAVKKSLFTKIDGFDETFPFPAMEDIDFHTRVVEHTKVCFVAEALVIHPWRPINAFKTFKKHLRSHKHFAKKYGMLNTGKYRLDRVKIFIGGIFIDFKILAGFSMRGTGYYLVKCFLNFCLIFA